MKDEFNSNFTSEYIDDEYLENYQSIARDKGLHITVDWEKNDLNIAYFKVYDNIDIRSSTHVARLHFKDSGMEYHINNSNHKKIWAMDAVEIKNLIALLNYRCNDNPKYSNW